MKIKRKIIEINNSLCDGCGICAKACSEGAIEIFDGKARLVSEKYCDGLGACIGECPKGAIKIYERIVDEFDPDAVELHLESRRTDEVLLNQTQSEAQTNGLSVSNGANDKRVSYGQLPCACPSSKVQNFTVKETSKLPETNLVSHLAHWPVKIRLIPPNAPFLRNAFLLVASDCTTVVLSNFHKDFLKGKVVMIGCPKFDEREAYVHKFAEIFELNEIREVMVLVMDVPCCHSMPLIVQKGMEAVEKDIPLIKVVVNPRGEIVEKKKI